MDFFDFITQGDLDDLPHDDPRAAFVAFTRIAHRRLGERLSELEGVHQDESSWRLANEAKQGFMNVVIAAAKKYQIEPFAAMAVPKLKNFDPDEHAQLRADLDHFIAQLVLDNSSRARRDSVLITSELKSSIKTYVHHLRDLIQKAADLDPAKREILLSQWVRRSAPANFGAPLPSFGNAKGSKPTIWTEARRDAPRGNAPARLNKCMENDQDVFWRNEPKVCAWSRDCFASLAMTWMVLVGVVIARSA